MQYITIYLNSKTIFKSRDIDKKRLYLRHRVYCVLEKLLLREVTASFM